MIRVLNFFCVGLMGLACLALYHVSESTRIARVDLAKVERNIASERDQMKVLQAEWERVAGPTRIQRLAESKLGMEDKTVVQLSSFTALPRRGEENPGNTPVQNASVEAPVVPEGQIHNASADGQTGL
jgi:cell division protein FtsL